MARVHIKTGVWVTTGIVIGLVIALAIGCFYTTSSSSESCVSCHVHPDSDNSWKQSAHFVNESGVRTDCAECHLPPKQEYFSYLATKTRMGAKDVVSYLLKKHESIDWEAKGELEYARRIVNNNSCVSCHANIYPEGISDDGIAAHLYYDENAMKLDLQCINCHLDAGHHNPNYSHSQMIGIISRVVDALKEEYKVSTRIDSFENFTERIPGTKASISMIAVPGGEFYLGSPLDEPYRRQDEGPQRRVKVSDFFIGETEVTWDQFWAFYNETMSEGRTPPEKIFANNSRPDIDAVSGPTPPFGNPDQGWGMDSRPAITMTHYAAEVFCQWLSLKTGKHYRLPTEAEWEYAARGGTQTPYFFDGSPKRFTSNRFIRRFSPADTAVIQRYAVYAMNSRNRTQLPSKVKANPFGIKNMLGNAMEYCADWYAEDAYSHIPDGTLNPKGPQSGREYVVRGGMYKDDAAELRCAARNHTNHDDWLKTDPQKPKSIWWYSDVKAIGFRVVCDKPDNI